MKNNLKKFREESALSLEELGAICDRSTDNLYHYEKKDGWPPVLTTAYAIAKVLDKTVYEVWPDHTEIIHRIKYK